MQVETCNILLLYILDSLKEEEEKNSFKILDIKSKLIILCVVYCILGNLW